MVGEEGQGEEGGSRTGVRMRMRGGGGYDEHTDEEDVDDEAGMTETLVTALFVSSSSLSVSATIRKRDE